MPDDLSDSDVNNNAQSQSIVTSTVSSPHSPPKGREICPPIAPSSKSHKPVSFAPDTRDISHNAKRYKEFYDRRDEVHMKIQRERAIERGDLVIRRLVYDDTPEGSDGTALPPPPDLGLTSPTSIQPTDTFVRPKRRHRSRRPKVVISPPSMADSPPQTPFPPLVPPNPPPSPLPSPPIVSDSANNAPPVCPTSSSKSSSIPSKLSATATTFVPTAVAAKKQSYFERFSAVRQVIGDAMSRATFSFAEFRRKFCRLTVLDDDLTEPAPASSMKAREMFDEEFCGHGNLPLPEGTVALNLESMDKYHVMSCVDCSVEGQISDDCYWSKLRLCVSCGMKPQLVPGSSGSPTPQYEGSGSEGNHASASYAFPTYTKSQIEKLLARGAIEKLI